MKPEFVEPPKYI